MAQKAIDDNEGSMLRADTRCSVCKERIPENMGRHMRSHGNEEFHKYMDEQRMVTPSEYKVCPHCQKTFHRVNLAKHVTKVHIGDRKPGTGTPGQEMPGAGVYRGDRLTLGQAGASASTTTVYLSDDFHRGMHPPSSGLSKSKIKRTKESTKPNKISAETKNYSLGQVQEAVRHMINHRGTETYTRNRIKEICQQKMPGLLEQEYDLVTDFTIVTAREVAGISQYAAAHRNMNASAEYQDAN